MNAPPIGLHAEPIARTVTVDGPDAAQVAERARSRLAEAFGDPPMLVLTSSCSAAMGAAATVLDLRPGDEVIVPAFGFPTAATAFLRSGASLRFADARADTGNIDPEAVEACLTPRTRAVVCMHYAGVGADVELFADLLRDRAIDLVEDAAHGLFGDVDGVPLGRFGRFGCTSLHRTKNVSVIDGGALVANHEADADRVSIAVDKGTNRVAFERGDVRAYEWSGPGDAARMGEAEVALLGPELDRSAERQARRHAVWERYASELAPWAARTGAELPVVPAGRHHPAHLFHIRLRAAGDRQPFTASCAEVGVQVAQHFGSLPHSSFGRTLADPRDPCPKALDFAERLVRIPLHHALDDDQVDRVIAAVTRWSPPGAPCVSG